MIFIIVLLVVTIPFSYYKGLKHGNLWTIDKFQEKVKKLKPSDQADFEFIKKDLYH